MDDFTKGLPWWGVVSFILFQQALNMLVYWIRGRIDLRKKKEEYDFDTTMVVERQQALTAKQELEQLKVQYASLQEMAKYREDLVAERDGELDFWRPLGERAEVLQTLVDAKDAQIGTQAIEISNLKLTIEEKDRQCRKLMKEAEMAVVDLMQQITALDAEVTEIRATKEVGGVG